MATAGEIITKALHLFGILDNTEDAQPSDFTTCVPILNDLLRADHMDGAAQYLIRTESFNIPAGVSGSIYTFEVGVDKFIPRDAVAIRSIWINDINLTVNRETRMAPKADVVRVLFPGLITKWHQERQSDGSILVFAWQPPRTATKILMEYGLRIPVITAADSVVDLPPEGIHDVALLFGRRICSAYGRSFEAVGPIAQDAIAADLRWRNWARGQQWLRFVRS